MNNYDFIEDVENVHCYNIASYLDQTEQKCYLIIKYLVETKSKSIYITFPRVEFPIEVNSKTFPKFYEDECVGVSDCRNVKSDCPVYLNPRNLSVSKHYIRLWDSNNGIFEVCQSRNGKKDFYVIDGIKEKVISMTKEEIERKLGYKINIIDDPDEKST